MIEQDKRLYGGVAAAVLVAAIGGFSVAKCTTDTPPAATEAAARFVSSATGATDKLLALIARYSRP